MPQRIEIRRKLGKLAIIVIAQLLGTSLWFSANATFDDLSRAWNLGSADVGRLTIAVQADSSSERWDSRSPGSPIAIRRAGYSRFVR